MVRAGWEVGKVGVERQRLGCSRSQPTKVPRALTLSTKLITCIRHHSVEAVIISPVQRGKQAK